MTRRPRLDRFPAEGTVLDALSAGYSELSSLAEETREVTDNAQGTNLENTSRIQTLSETADTLEDIDGDDVVGRIPDNVGELRCSWTENRRRGISRSQRRDNAVAALDAAMSVMKNWVDERDAESEEDRADGVADALEDARSAMEDVESHIGEAEGVEFQGAFS